MDVISGRTQPAERPGEITGALHALQQQEGYLEREALKRLAVELDVPLSRLYGVATFYAAFRLEPRGHCHIQVCHGTACHVQGAVQLTEKLERELDVRSGGTTPDRGYSLEKVRCLGCCGLAPVVKIDEKVHGRLNQARLKRLLRPEEEAHENSVES